MQRRNKAIQYLLDNFYDGRFHKHITQYIFQCALATAALAATLMTLGSFPNVAVIATIGATSFTVFAMPHKIGSRARYIIGAYLIGITCGTVCYFASKLFALLGYAWVINYHDEIFGAIAVGLSIFFMVVMNLEHPPGAALALGLVISQWSLGIIGVTLAAIILILLFRHMLRSYLIDLL